MWNRASGDSVGLACLSLQVLITLSLYCPDLGSGHSSTENDLRTVDHACSCVGARIMGPWL